MMVEKHRIEILVTDGREIRRFIWMERTSNGIYWGYCSEGGEIFRASYHEDGNKFWTVEGKTRPVGAGPRLSEFRGIHQLVNASVSVDHLLDLPITTPYELERSDSVVYIDLRPFGPKGLHLVIMEPLRFELLSGLLKKPYWKNSQIHVFTPIEPWVAILYGYGAS